jgi:hypothetical protein
MAHQVLRKGRGLGFREKISEKFEKQRFVSELRGMASFFCCFYGVTRESMRRKEPAVPVDLIQV